MRWMPCATGQLGEFLEGTGLDIQALNHQVHAARLRPGRTSRKTWCALRIIVAVSSQPIHASVTEQPYLSCARSFGIAWLPGSMLLSIIIPTTERLPSRIWFHNVLHHQGWNSGFFHELACEQSTTTFTGSFALLSACSASEIDTES